MSTDNNRQSKESQYDNSQDYRVKEVARWSLWLMFFSPLIYTLWTLIFIESMEMLFLRLFILLSLVWTCVALFPYKKKELEEPVCENYAEIAKNILQEYERRSSRVIHDAEPIDFSQDEPVDAGPRTLRKFDSVER